MADLNEAAAACDIPGPIGTHTFRKTFRLQLLPGT
ncbi:hypothetical protein JOC94_001515 [Bacillus thermophilus]|uniref:Uncharacterized protein n=1 Tax=Siminovitchia thermophila TaxID=1245522 RepID=A0ABS2R4H1_9BACI|nr:hypothetical protein [Siminovitchia thermophila]